MSNTTTAPAKLQDKFDRLATVLGGELVERTGIIDTQILALISGTHHFQIGEPGIAKSLSTRRLIAHIDGLDPSQDYFETLMTRFSSPEELFGPLDLAALKQSRYRFVTDGYAPSARIWFLDEIWKANASILNALLMALNERLFRNDGSVQPLPLHAMFCASNEMPEGEELNALYDRIHFRHIIRPIQEQGNFITMLKLKHQDDEKVVSWDEIVQAQKEASEIVIPDDVLEALNTVRNDLRAAGIEPTDRRFKETTKIIRAKTWLDGDEIADIQHMQPLAHVLWTTPEEQPVVERVILELANPLDKEAITLLETVEKIASDIDKVLADKGMDQGLRNKKGVELHGKVERARKDLTKLKKQVEASGRKSVKVDEVHQRLIGTTKRLIEDLFTITLPDES